MKLEYLEEFLAIAGSGSYGAAAENMYISVSALSRHITLLEEELGAELINRGTRSISLTDAGNELLPYARTIVDARNEYLARFKDSKKSADKILSLGFARSIIQYGIMDTILTFKHNNPDITLLLSEGSPSTRFQMLKNNECDFILGYKYIFYDSADVISVPLLEDYFCIAMPSTHPLAKEPRIALRQVKNEHFILNLRGGAAYNQCMDIFKSAGINPHVLSYVESSRFILEMVQKGMGLALVEKKRFEETVPDGVTLVDFTPLERQTLALIYKKRDLSQAQKRFLAYVNQQFNISD